MSTIALYAGKINMMPDLLQNMKQSVNNVKTELNGIFQQVLAIDNYVCNLSDAGDSIRASTQMQEERITNLENFQKNHEEFVAETVRIDGNVADTVNGNKSDFYDQYDYLRPECEREKKGFFERAGEWLKKAGEWCKEHWKEIVQTVVIVVGAVLAIAAVVCTGGVALVPMLATAMTALGMSAALATSIATVISITVAVIAVASTVGSSTLNIFDTWGDFSNNTTFKKWQKALNLTSSVFNSIYSVGNMYNSIKGVSGKEFIARQKAIENGKMGYSNLEANNPNMRHKAGGDYNSNRKQQILEENMRRNDGVLRSDQTGKILEPPAKSMKGVSPPQNEAQIDHIFPRALGGENSFTNAQVIERAANRAKSDVLNFTDYLQYSIPDKGSVGDFFKYMFMGNMNPVTNIGVEAEKNGK